MANEFLAVSDGTFTLSETKNKNQFYFYRNDGNVLTDIDRKPMMDLYHTYIFMYKIMNDEIPYIVNNNICSEISDDGKIIRLTIHDIGHTKQVKKSNVKKKPNFLKYLLHKIWG